MVHIKSDFIRFAADADRVIANLETAYEQWLDARQQLSKLPVSMYWKTVGGVEYLGVKLNSQSNGTTGGARSPETELELEQFQQTKEALKAQVARADGLIAERAALYRTLRLPVLGDRQAELLRALDIYGVLRNDVILVGTNAFCAYELLCGAKFPTGNEETEDFDLAWCRGTKVSLATTQTERRRTLLQVLQTVTSYSLVEQEWLLKGRPVSFVVATVRRRACPVFVPDPRWMAVHKLWLSAKPERRDSKKAKDKRQGDVLLDACRYFLQDTYPLDLDFVFDLPSELRDVFDQWAKDRGYDPTQPDSGPETEPTGKTSSHRFRR